MPPSKQPHRQRLLNLISGTVLGAIAVTALSGWWMWHSMTIDHPVVPSADIRRVATSIPWSESTPRALATMFGSQVRVVWLRAFDWQEKRGPPGHPQPDPERFRFVPDPAAQMTDLREPGAYFDGGGKDAEVPGVGIWFDRRGAFAIWGLDSEAGVERELVPVGRLFQPLITPDGQTVIYTCESENADGSTRFRVHQVAWDGTGDRIVADGYGLWVSDEQGSGERWLYGTDRFDGVWRLSLSTPNRRERLYQGPLSRRFSVSADGKTACGEFPWPRVGILDLATGVIDYQGLRDGCNASLAPDGSGMVSILNGAHTGVTIFTEQRAAIEVDLQPSHMKNTSTGQRGKIWNPKWAADSHHVIMSGPIRARTADAADIWVGEYAPDRGSIATWIQVTKSDSFDVYPFLWRKADQPRRSPTVSSSPVVRTTRILGTDAVAVLFDRSVSPANFQMTMNGNEGATRLRQGTSERMIVATFLSQIPDTGHLQVTSRDASGTATVLSANFQAPSWPSRRAGMCARWAGRDGENTLSVNGALVTTTVVPGGFARFDRDGFVVLHGGRYAANGVVFGEPIKKSERTGLGIDLGFRLLGRGENITATATLVDGKRPVNPGRHGVAA